MELKFTECLNDTWDYFFLGDPTCLSNYQMKHHLSDDLIHEFTTNDSGDKAVEQGVVIAMAGIANYPYHIVFQIDEAKSIFDNEKQELQFKQEGYILEVVNQEVYLMTLPYIKNWSEGKEKLISNGIRPRVELENGYYTVEILGGETWQEEGWEPTIEFNLQKKETPPKFEVEEVYFLFKIQSKEY